MDMTKFTAVLADAGVGVEGETIFANMMPAGVSRAVMLRDKTTGTEIDYEMPGYYKTGFQAIARAPDYLDGQELINKTIAALTMREVSLGDIGVKHCLPETMPISFPLSDGNLIEFTVRFKLVFNER